MLIGKVLLSLQNYRVTPERVCISELYTFGHLTASAVGVSVNTALATPLLCTPYSPGRTKEWITKILVQLFILNTDSSLRKHMTFYRSSWASAQPDMLPPDQQTDLLRVIHLKLFLGNTGRSTKYKNLCYFSASVRFFKKSYLIKWMYSEKT